MTWSGDRSRRRRSHSIHVPAKQAVAEHAMEVQHLGAGGEVPIRRLRGCANRAHAAHHAIDCLAVHFLSYLRLPSTMGLDAIRSRHPMTVDLVGAWCGEGKQPAEVLCPIRPVARDPPRPASDAITSGARSLVADAAPALRITEDHLPLCL